MTNAQMFDLMMARLAGRTSETTRGLLVLELNAMIDQLEGGPIKPHFIEFLYPSVTVADQEYSDLPADFLEEYEEGSLRIKNVDGDWEEADVLKVDIEVLERETDNADHALPEGYAIYGDRIYWGPIPDAAYDFKLKYYGNTAPVEDDTGDITNPWLLKFFNFTTLATMHMFALTHLQGTELASKIAPSLKIANDSFVRAVTSRKVANTDPLLDNTEN